MLRNCVIKVAIIIKRVFSGIELRFIRFFCVPVRVANDEFGTVGEDETGLQHGDRRAAAVRNVQVERRIAFFLEQDMVDIVNFELNRRFRPGFRDLNEPCEEPDDEIEDDQEKSEERAEIGRASCRERV